MNLTKTIALLAVFTLPTSNLWSAPANDTLQFFSEEAKVVTASRYAQPISEAPIAIYVITSKEIEASGAVNIWDLMRFAPGMDVSDSRSSDGNRAAVSVRGFPSAYVSNLQVLVDGRSVYTPLNGGVVWHDIPVQIQDIDCIEIARGPNAALYGSNATMGTINIITKRPTAQNTAVARAAAGNLGTRMASTSYEDVTGKFGLRVSQGYLETEGFNTPTGMDANDDLRTNVGNFRGYWTPRAGTDVEMMTGVTKTNALLRGASTVRNNALDHFEMVRLSQVLRSSTIDFFVSNNNENLHASPITDFSRRQVDSEIQQRFGWLADRVQSTWGMGYRNTVARADQVFESNPVQRNLIWRGFTQQAVRITNRLTLNGAFSYENSDTGGSLLAYQAATLYHMTALQVVRLAYAVAPSLPTLFSKHGDYAATPVVHYIGNDNNRASQARSVEVGYQGNFAQRRLQTNIDLHYADVSNLETSETTMSFFPSFSQTIEIRDQNHVLARGAEAALKYQLSQRHSIYFNYTYEHLSDSKDIRSVIEAVPANKFNIGGISALGGGFTASMNAGYKDAYLASTEFGSARISSYWRLDARLAYKIKRAELFVAGQNLTRAAKIEAADGLAVSRTYQAGISIELGGLK